MPVTISGPRLAVETCVRRLAPYSPRRTAPPSMAGTGTAVELELDAVGSRVQAGDLACHISWPGPAELPPGHSAAEGPVQALSGLMHLHGRDWGGPRRLGIEVGSVAAGVLAGHAVLAAAVGAHRGRPARPMETSVLQAALLVASHQVAAATCDEEWVPAPPAPAPGPPFVTADGHWFEIETLDPDAWRAFWLKLGADGSDRGRGWTLFRSRYYRGTCTLPTGFHETTAACTLAEVAEAAEACGVSLAPVRSYAEVLAGGLRADAGYPAVTPLAGGAAGGRANGPAGGPANGPAHGPAHVSGRASASDAGADLPLAGLRVVEATNRMQGPLAGLLLAWLGAEVVKVEPPGGDVGRGVPPLADDKGSFFLCFNRGKRSVELDLSAPSGRAALVDLVAGADVFLHNWRPGKAAQWSLAADDLARHNPGLVYAEASGWGEGADRPRLVGTDFLVQAYAGVAHGLSPEGQPAIPSRVLLVDCLGALVACEGVLGGLLRRELTGRGCRVHSSLLAGAMTLQAHVVDAFESGREQGRRLGRPVWGPLDVPMAAADGLVAVGVDGDDGLAALCRAVGVDPGRGSRSAREDAVAARLAARPVSWCEEALPAAGVPCASVTTDLADLAADPRLAELFEPLAGPSRAPARPWSFSGVAGRRA